jgi:hypothetical protein
MVRPCTTIEMAAMHRAVEHRDYAAAVAHLEVWAGLLGADAVDGAPG